MEAWWRDRRAGKSKQNEYRSAIGAGGAVCCVYPPPVKFAARPTERTSAVIALHFPIIALICGSISDYFISPERRIGFAVR